MSGFDNIVARLKLVGHTVKAEVAEQSLRRAALWDEVKDKLKDSGASLSGGQQRLCIARTLAVSPEGLLTDGPASALDPLATLRIKELIRTLRDGIAIVIVTHNMQQAARVSDQTAFMLAGEERIGELVEVGVPQISSPTHVTIGRRITSPDASGSGHSRNRRQICRPERPFTERWSCSRRTSSAWGAW